MKASQLIQYNDLTIPNQAWGDIPHKYSWVISRNSFHPVDWDGDPNFCLSTKYDSRSLLSGSRARHVHIRQTSRNQAKSCAIDHTSRTDGVP